MIFGIYPSVRVLVLRSKERLMSLRKLTVSDGFGKLFSTSISTVLTFVISR